MKWEILKVYKPIEKDELPLAKKTIEAKVYEKLKPLGFKKIGKKFYRVSNDLIHFIFLDSRGSWSGSSNNVKTLVAVISIYDTDILINNYEPISNSYLQDLDNNLKNYYQITQEYELFSEFLSSKIVELLIPYFNKYESSFDVIKKGITIGKTTNLIELCNKAVNQENQNELEELKYNVLKKLKL